MVAKSAEARKVLRELEKEKAAAAAQLGQSLDWSAADTATLGQISSILDRKAQLLALYEGAEDVKMKVKLSGEVRLLEQAAARLALQVKTELPAARESHTTRKARRAATMRWDRTSAREAGFGSAYRCGRGG